MPWAAWERAELPLSAGPAAEAAVGWGGAAGSPRAPQARQVTSEAFRRGEPCSSQVQAVGW
eukprot:12744906-Alexandrium_andersonii.AAC.1